MPGLRAASRNTVARKFWTTRAFSILSVMGRTSRMTDARSARCLRGTRRACFAVRGSPGRASRVALLSSVFLLSSNPSSDSSSPLHFATASRAACRSFFNGLSGGSSSDASGLCFKSAAYSRAPKKGSNNGWSSNASTKGGSFSSTTSFATSANLRSVSTSSASSASSKHAANCLSNNASSARRVAAYLSLAARDVAALASVHAHSSSATPCAGVGRARHSSGARCAAVSRAEATPAPLAPSTCARNARACVAPSSSATILGLGSKDDGSAPGGPGSSLGGDEGRMAIAARNLPRTASQPRASWKLRATQAVSPLRKLGWSSANAEPSSPRQASQVRMFSPCLETGFGPLGAEASNTSDRSPSDTTNTRAPCKETRPVPRSSHWPSSFNR
mmetsp:Transcript_5799/g.16280  ORF Transcript_5799/g.16280 Transcript_5799/m.16280 type:complete len:390 (+) Transcript_5799:1969-3138(+)